MQVYLVTAMTHVIALEAGQSSQGALNPITPVQLITNIVIYYFFGNNTAEIELAHWLTRVT